MTNASRLDLREWPNRPNTQRFASLLRWLPAIGLLSVACATGPDSEPNNEAQVDGSISPLTVAEAAVASDPRSAQRDPNRSWKEYATASMAASRQKSPVAARSLAAPTVINSQVPVASADFSNVPTWNDADIWSVFRASRDARFMHAFMDSQFVRRPSWLYPDNGCWLRAELVSIAAVEAGKTRPYNLFAFGDLTVRTPNSPKGSVSWWYHVVPVVKSASTGEPYVLDAAIDPTQPLPWKTWLLKQVDSLDKVTVTVGDAGAYDVGIPVTGATPRAKSTVVHELEDGYYLLLEWNRQIALGRDPVAVLSDYAPWQAVPRDFNQDRKPDLIWHNGGTGRTVAWLMDGSTAKSRVAIEPGQSITDSLGWRFVGTGDFNQDGHTDILWSHGATGYSFVWFMNGVSMIGGEYLAGGYSVPESSGWRIAATGDFDYDGKVDLVWRHGDMGITLVWYLDGLNLKSMANIAPENPIPASSGWRLLGTGDFNRDGKADVLWYHPEYGVSYAWFLDGVAVIGEAQLAPNNLRTAESGFAPSAIGDYDYDGKPDLVWYNGSVGETEAWYLNGTAFASDGQLDSLYSVPARTGWVPVGGVL